ncbi:cation:proton antiporter domain-containing protein [Kutzneria sp. CA-103260]|uniref:cation:proton antiporter domain-containing protein n=1 Tax=Kutzneria sp. CA-103260 TaxID=2802641 RepID=UPI001BA8A763|nr:cation:proton antiporter [Kutzneria sp. CA-103260]QUQ65545.1 Na+/H+ antiporter [Kutzneria sp. CA-103260]
MNSLFLAIAVALTVRSLTAALSDRWNLGAPVVMVLAGVVVGLINENSIAALLNTEAVQQAAEIILAVLLFTDATEVRGGRLWGGSPGLVARVLLLALPLSLALAMAFGWLLFPDLPWPVLLLIAGVVVPTDFAPAERLVRDRGLPTHVRNVLNVESGYNDGIVSPLFLFALILAGDHNQERTPLDALGTAVPFALKALIVGVVLGTALALLMNRAHLAGWMTEQSGRVAILLAPLLTYTVTVAIDGNGFVASFVCGTAFRYVHRLVKARHLRTVPAGPGVDRTRALSEDFRLLEDATSVLTMIMWFMMGIAAVLTVAIGVPWQVLLFCAVALTVVRLGPVLLALLGSRFSTRERLLVGALGPRGTTSIVFGLLAFNRLAEGSTADTILVITVTCVLGSVLVHGLGARPVTRLLTSERKSAPQQL